MKGEKTSSSKAKAVVTASIAQLRKKEPVPYMEPDNNDYAMAADPIVNSMTDDQIRKAIDYATEKMKEAAKNLDFLLAAQYRDEVLSLQKHLKA